MKVIQLSRLTLIPVKVINLDRFKLEYEPVNERKLNLWARRQRKGKRL